MDTRVSPKFSPRTILTLPSTGLYTSYKFVPNLNMGQYTVFGHKKYEYIIHVLNFTDTASLCKHSHCIILKWGLKHN